MAQTRGIDDSRAGGIRMVDAFLYAGGVAASTLLIVAVMLEYFGIRSIDIALHGLVAIIAYSFGYAGGFGRGWKRPEKVDGR